MCPLEIESLSSSRFVDIGSPLLLLKICIESSLVLIGGSWCLDISIQEERDEVASYQSAAKITPPLEAPGTSTTIRSPALQAQEND